MVRMSASWSAVGTLIRARCFRDVNVLGSLTAANDVVAPFNPRRGVPVDRGGLLLPETKSAQKCPEAQDLASSRDAE